MEVPEPLEVWEQVYTTKPSNEVSWFQQEPATSLRLIKTFATGPAASVIDIGGGTSSLVDRLLEEDFADVTVLDVSQHALTEVRERLGARADRTTFLQRDLRTWIPDREYEVWHDRAVFHFLTEPSARDHYVENTEHGVGAGGVLVLGTFAEDGPTECSGLPVTRYSPKDLGAVFSPSFSMVHQQREEHVTPAGIIQPFTWVVLRRA